MKRIAILGAAALLVGTTIVSAQQQQQIRPYYVGNEGVGLPAAPPAPTEANPNPSTTLNPMQGATMYGALFSVESCTYDPVRGLIVAPNRGVGQNVRANDAWISLINPNGSVHTPRWIGIQNPGAQRDNMDPPLVLNEPFGSMVRNGILYLADRDGGTPNPEGGGNLPQVSAIAMFDMATGAPVDRIVPRDSEGATVPAFNDIWVTEDGVVYGTVSGNNGAVWRVTPDGAATAIITAGMPGLNSPNGIAMDGDGNLVVVNIGDNGVNTYNAETGELIREEQAAQPGLDGIEIMPDGTKFVSSVTQGGISMIRPGEEAVLIATNIPSAASICYDSGTNQLVVPMNAHNGLSFVPLNGIWEP